MVGMVVTEMVSLILKSSRVKGRGWEVGGACKREGRGWALHEPLCRIAAQEDQVPLPQKSLHVPLQSVPLATFQGWVKL